MLTFIFWSNDLNQINIFLRMELSQYIFPYSLNVLGDKILILIIYEILNTMQFMYFFNP